MNELLKTKVFINDIKVSEKEIKECAEKLTGSEIQEFANDYKISIEQARHDLAEYIVFNFKLNIQL